jgi:hypothetical protein
MYGYRFLFSLLVLTLLPPIFAAADESRDQDGQYFCLVEHVAGVVDTTSEGQGPMHSGKINLPEKEMKFFIKVGPRKYDDPIVRKVCENDINYWFMEIFEKGLPYKDGTPYQKTVDTRDWIGKNCFASEEITWKSFDGSLTLDFRGYGGAGFHQYYSFEPSTWFEFYQHAGHTFMMGMGHLYGGPVVAYGHCTKIEPPK